MTLITKHVLRPLRPLIGPLIGPDLVLQFSTKQLTEIQVEDGCGSGTAG